MLLLRRTAYKLLGLLVVALLVPACGGSSSGSVVNANGVLAFLLGAVPVAENAGAGFVTLAVARTGKTSGAVSVDFSTTNGSAQAGSDFDNTTGTLNWADGVGGNQTFNVPLIDDLDVEGDETFTVTLSNPTGGAVLGPTIVVTVTIQDDNAPAQGVLQFSQAVFSVNESDLQVTITVTRSGGSSGDASVDLTDLLTGTATGGGVDYTFASPETLNWSAGALGGQTAVITIVADGVLDAAAVETIDLQLQTPVGAVLGTLIDATVEITDAGSPGTIAFTAAGFNVSESAPTATITLTRAGGTLGPASVNVVDLGTGTAAGSGVDYTFASPELVSWADGEGGDKDVTVDIVDNLAVDGNRTVNFELQTFSGAATGAQTTTQLTIQDDEAPPSPGQLTFTGTPYSVAESTGTITITVTRQNGSSGAVTVTVATADGTASSAVNPAAKRDYVAVSTPLSWTDGETGPKTFNITILNNDPTGGSTGDNGSDETFTVTMSGVTGGATIVGTNPQTVTIQDD